MKKELISSLEKNDANEIKRTILKRILDKVLLKKNTTNKGNENG
jgi:hypothetical protein